MTEYTINTLVFLLPYTIGPCHDDQPTTRRTDRTDLSTAVVLARDRSAYPAPGPVPPSYPHGYLHWTARFDTLSRPAAKVPPLVLPAGILA